MFMMMTFESGYKFRSEINREMQLRNMYSAQVSSTLCQEFETCFTEEPQTTNNETCNELQKLSQTPTRVFAKKGSPRSNKKNYTIRHMLSRQKIQDRNLTTLLDLSAHMIDHPAVSCFSQSRASEREPGAHRRILSARLPEHSRLETKIVTFSDKKHGRNEIDVVTFHVREHTRGTHGMHRFQDPHNELIFSISSVRVVLRRIDPSSFTWSLQSTVRFCPLS